MARIESSKARSYKGSTREILDYPPMLQACHVQEIMGYSEGKAYELLRSKGCPTIRNGKRMTTPRDLFWEYIIKLAVQNVEI